MKPEIIEKASKLLNQLNRIKFDIEKVKNVLKSNNIEFFELKTTFFQEKSHFQFTMSCEEDLSETVSIPIELKQQILELLLDSLKRRMVLIEKEIKLL